MQQNISLVDTQVQLYWFNINVGNYSIALFMAWTVYVNSYTNNFIQENIIYSHRKITETVTT